MNKELIGKFCQMHEGFLTEVGVVYTITLTGQEREEVLAALEAVRPEERGMFVPLEVWNWLMGEGPDFEPTEKQKGALMGPGRYWWRSELCRRMEDAGSCPLSPRGTLVDGDLKEQRELHDENGRQS